MYPMGIPVSIYVLLRYLGVPAMAKRKEAEAVFRAMLDLYVHARHDTMGAKIARYVGGEHNSKISSGIIEERTANLYRDVSQNETVQVNSARLVAWFESVCVSVQCVWTVLHCVIYYIAIAVNCLTPH
jgi:hypothetical protein